MTQWDEKIEINIIVKMTRNSSQRGKRNHEWVEKVY